jgi:hypothetical protein
MHHCVPLLSHNQVNRSSQVLLGAEIKMAVMISTGNPWSGLA